MIVLAVIGGRAQARSGNVTETGADYSKEAFIVEMLQTVATFENDGTSTRTTQGAVRIQSEAGVQHWGVISSGYSSANEQVEIGCVRVHKADGRVIETPADLAGKVDSFSLVLWQTPEGQLKRQIEKDYDAMVSTTRKEIRKYCPEYRYFPGEGILDFSTDCASGQLEPGDGQATAAKTWQLWQQCCFFLGEPEERLSEVTIGEARETLAESSGSRNILKLWHTITEIGGTIMSQKLAGKVAIVTGASKGIGASIAKHLAAEGAAVIVNYSASKEGADRVVDDITAKGGKAIAVKADVTKQDEIGHLFDPRPKTPLAR